MRHRTFPVGTLRATRHAPSVPVSPRSPRLPESAPAPAGRKRLLLADDLASIRESLGRLLWREGYEVALASTGVELLQRVSAEEFDLVLLDLSMPELNGWEALKRLADLRPALPVIVITAHPHQREWVEPSGACALLEKPFEIDLLLEVIREVTDAHAGNSRWRFRHLPSTGHDQIAGLLPGFGINE